MKGQFPIQQVCKTLGVKVRKLLKQKELQAIQPKSFVPKTTNSRHTLGYAPNGLKMTVTPVAPNQAYV